MEPLATHCFVLNPEAPSDSQLVAYSYLHSDDLGVFTTHKLINMNPYSTTSLELTDLQITPERLRLWADELENELNKAQIMLEESK